MNTTIFLDRGKTFDWVWHSDLLIKLQKMNTLLSLINIIDNYLKNRKKYVSINDTPQKSENITASIILDVNDTPNSHLQLVVCADDTTIIASSWCRRGMQ